MELSDPEWAASALFSPSKARQQAAAAKDWIFVDSWLSKKYHPKPVPPFERNGDTLQYFLTLVSFNEKADEEEELCRRVEKNALTAFETQEHNELDRRIYGALEANLSSLAQDALQEQAEASVAISAPSSTPEAIARSTISLTSANFELEQQLGRISRLQKTLTSEQHRLEALLAELRSDSFATAPELQQQTTDWTKQTKLLTLKLDEYKDRLASLAQSAPPPKPSVEDLVARKMELESVKQKQSDLEGQIAEFEGLPAEPREAKAVVLSLRDQLRELAERREQLFQEMVVGDRPVR